MRFRTAAMVLSLSACAAPQPASAPRQAVELAGRVAGAPKRCVTIQQSASLRVADGDNHTLIYPDGRTIWANHMGCGFGRDDILILEPIGSSYCRGDIVRSMDRISRIPGPACVLGDFTPYTR